MIKIKQAKKLLVFLVLFLFTFLATANFVQAKTVNLLGVGTDNAYVVGNVGIGVTNPVNKLDVSGYVNASSGNGYAIGNMAVISGAASLITFGSSPSITNASINTDGASRIYLKTGGNIGIGTTNPGYKLDVSGMTHVTDSNDVGVIIETTGTNNAAYNRIISGNGTTSGRYAYTIFQSSETVPERWNLGMYGNRNFQINDTNGALLTITPTGYVGVGTTNPTANLHTSSLLATGGVTFSLLGGAGQQMVVTDNAGTLATRPIPSIPSGTTDQTLRHDGSSWVASNFLKNSDSLVSIGSSFLPTDSQVLSVNGSATFTTHGAGGVGINGGGGLSITSGNIRLYSDHFIEWYDINQPLIGWWKNGGDSHMDFQNGGKYIFSGGSVGIGVANPAAVLDISASVPAIVFRSGLTPWGQISFNSATNISIGLNAATNGQSNSIAIGSEAMKIITSGTSNTAVGYQAFSLNNPPGGTGSYNTSIGAGSMSMAFSNPSYTTGIGYNACYTSGSYSTCVGATSGGANATNSVSIGYFARAASNAVAIGYGANAAANKLVIDNDGSGALILGDFSTNKVAIATSTGSKTLSIGGDIQAYNYTYWSDRNMKKDIRPLENSLAKVLRLQGVTYKWKANPDETGNQIGLIAQDVEKVFPELVSGDNPKSLQYGNLVAPLIEAIKEQQQQIDNLETRIKILEMKK